MWRRMLMVAALALGCHREATRAAPVASGEASPATAGTGAMAPLGRLSEHVRPVAYVLRLDIAPSKPDFSGQVRIDVELARAVESVVLHARELDLTRIVLSRPGVEGTVSARARPVADNRSADDGLPDDGLADSGLADSGLVALEVSEPIGPGQARISIDFTGKLDQRLRGLYKVESGGQAYAFTQFEAIDARQAFPCFDEPRFKTPFDITLVVPSELRAISNTRVTAEVALPNGQTEVTFARTEKLPTYLVAFAVGPLDVVDATPLEPTSVRTGALPFRGIAPRGRGAELGFALRETPALLQSLERYFGIAYPYDKLDLIAVPDFAAGAMENAGAITFRDTLLLVGAEAPEWQRRASVSVNAHELAHQWFGNLVTMPWWDDVWLNEGFATWLAGRVVEEVHPEFNAEFARVAGLDRAFDVDSKESARKVRQPIASDHDIKNAFDAITYTKGGALLAMFERYLGADAFRAGLRLYLERHRFDTATSQDLLLALEESSGKSLAGAFSSFLDQPGVPRIAAELDCSLPSAPRVRLSQRRYRPLGSRVAGEALWQVPVCLRYGLSEQKRAPGREGGNAQAAEQCVLIDSESAELGLNVSSCPRWLFPNAMASGYYRWSLAPADFDALVARGFGALGTGELLSLLSNTEAGARAGEQSFEQLMAVTRKVGRERPRELVLGALGVLTRVREALLTEAELPSYRRLVRSMVADRAQELGLFPASAREGGDMKLLRPGVVAALAFEARDRAVRAELHQLGLARLGLREDARLPRLPAELVEVALGVAVQEGGVPVIERAISALGASNDGVERGRLLTALGHNHRPEHSPLVLALSLADGLRTNERAATIAGQIRQPETREAAYAWVLEHFDALVARLGADNAAPLVQLVGAFCTEESAARAQQFFGPRVDALPGGPRLLRLNVETVELCAAFARAHRAGARAYFASTSSL